MGEGRGTGGGGLSVAQWIALNDEIAALIRAGMPLDRGLLGAGGDYRGRLGAVATGLARRLEGGASLSEALAAEGDRVPPVYRAVVEAGSRSGRLASALENLADVARRQMELRNLLGLSMIYPLIVVCLAYALFVGFLVLLVPRLASAFGTFRLEGAWGLSAMEAAGRAASAWWWIGPALLLFALFAWWRSGRAWAFPVGGGSPMGRLPWFGRASQWTTWSGFADLLALLVGHGVPMGSALRLAGSASGDPRLGRSAEELAREIEAGTVRFDGRLKGFPPMLAWLVHNPSAGGSLEGALRQAADGYRRRAILQSEVARILVPIAATVAVGVLTCLLYVVMLFLPMTALMEQLSRSFNG
ncbi:MAG: type II secretion system F family protein [Isosphaeraceae bacterium]